MAVILLLALLAVWGFLRKSNRPDQMAELSRREVVWRPKCVLNGSEAAVYANACRITTDIDPTWRVWPPLNRIKPRSGSTFLMCYGPEFVSKVLDRWAYERGVTLDFSRPGKPTDNGLIESFNGRLRDECLDTHWFLSLEDARAKIEA